MRLSTSPPSAPDFRALFESAPGLYLVLTPDLRIVAASDAYLRTTMTRREEILGREVFDVFPDNPEDPTATGVLDVCASFNRVLQNRVSDVMPLVKYDIRQPESEGGGFQERYWSALNSPVFGTSGKVTHIIHRAEDVTEIVRLKQQEEEQRELTEELERSVIDRTAELEAANKELEAFSYSVSHDLRAPLRSITGFSQALLEDYAAQLDEEGRQHLQRICGASARMALLIDDMLELARLTRREVRREPVDLSALARAVAADLQNAEPERELEVVIAEDLPANVDPQLLRVVLENLLGNAWKFTSKRGRARIEFGALGQENGKRTFFVRDDGAGFDMAYADKLFAPFQRLHGIAEYAGTGVGLATVQRIVARHGGRVWAEGVVGKGATFYFTL